MRFFFCALGFALVNISAQGQQLAMYPSFGGAHFEYEKDTMVYQVSARQVSQILFDDPEAHAEFKRARTNYSVAGVMGFIGVGLLIIPVGSAIAGGDPEWNFAIGGAALILGSIPFTKGYRHHAMNAVDIYNKKHTAFRPRTEYYFFGSGVKMVIRF